MAERNRILHRISQQNSRNLLSQQPSSNGIHFEKPIDLDSALKLKPSSVACCHGKLYFQVCSACKRTAKDGTDNFERFVKKHKSF